MKLTKILSAAALSVGLFTSGAQAAVLDLTSILSYKENGFQSSMIHNQMYSQESGRIKAYVSSVITGGTFDTVSGVIKFMGSITRDGQSSTFSAMGTLMNSIGRIGGLTGDIEFTFSGDLMDNAVKTFFFADESYGLEPNGYVTDGNNQHIALWGDLGNYSREFCADNIHKCLGIDLRIAFEDNTPPGGIVPLPASAFFLLAGLGGLGVTRKLRKKA